MALKRILQTLLSLTDKVLLSTGMAFIFRNEIQELSFEKNGVYPEGEVPVFDDYPRRTRNHKKVLLRRSKPFVAAVAFVIASLFFMSAAVAAYRVTAVNYGGQSGTANSGTGSSVTYTLTLSKTGGSTGVPDNIALTWAGGTTPTGVTWLFTTSTEGTINNPTTNSASFTPTSAGTGSTILLTVTTSNSTPANSYGLTISLTDNNQGGGTMTSSGLSLLVKGLSSTGTLSAFTTSQNVASASQNVAVSGGGLTSNVTITAPTGFEVSTNNSTFSGSVSLTQVSGVVSAPIYIRIKSTATVGPVSGNVVISGTPFTSVNVAVTGTVVGPIVETGSLGAFNTNFGTASAVQTFTVSDTYLAAGILVTPPAGYEVSKDGTNYSSTVTLGTTGPLSPAATVSIRLAANASAGAHNGNVVLSTTSATSVNVAVTGTVTGIIAETGGPYTFSSSQGTASASQSFTASGTGLTTNITVTAPTGFEVSLNNSTFTTTVTLNQSGGTVNTTTVFVRLKNSAAVGVNSGIVSLTSAGSTPLSQPTLTGTVVGPIVESGTPTTFSTLLGTASSAQTFTVSDTYLATGILVTPPAGYEVSTDGTNFSSTVTVGSSGPLSPAVTISIRLAASTPAGAYNGPVVLSTSVTGNVNLPVITGAVYGPIVETDAIQPFTTSFGTPSTSQSFTVSDAYISGGLLVTAPAGFEVSANNTTFAPTATLGGTGALTTTTAYIRLSATAPAGSASGNVVLSTSTGGAASINIAVTGTISGAIAESGTPSAFAVTFGSASPSQSITVSGSGLSADITVEPPVGYEIGTDNLNFPGTPGNPITLTQSVAGTVSPTLVYIRLSAADAVGPYSGVIALKSNGTADLNSPAISGTVVGPIVETGTIGAFSTNFGTPSAPQNFTVQDDYLISGITVGALTGYEYSTDGTTYSGTLTVGTSGPLATTTVFVRLAANAVAGLHNGNIVLSSSVPPPVNVATTGTVYGPIVETGTVAAFTATQGTVPTAKSFTVSDTYITGGLLVTAPAGFEVSTDNSTFAPTVTLGSTGTLATTTVYVRLTNLAPVGPNSGNVVLSTTSAASVNVAVTGTVVGPIIVTGTLNPFTSNFGTASVAQSFTVADSYLLTNLTVAAVTGYEYSTNGTTYTSTLTLGSANTPLATTTIFVRLAANATTGTYNGNIVLSTSVPPTVNVSVTGTVSGVIVENGALAAFSTRQGTASASQSFTVSGTGLTNNILITAPTGYEVSTNNFTFTATVTLNRTGTTVNTTTVYIRLTNSASLGVNAGAVSLTSSGSTTVSLPAVTGVVVGPIVETGTVAAFTTTFGTASSIKTFSVSDTYLAAGILVTPPTGYEVSTDGTNFTSTVTLGSTGALAATTVSVRLAATATVGTHNANVALTTSVASTVTSPALTGTVYGPIVETGALNAFSTNYGTPSTSQSFTVSDTYTTGGLLVTAPTGYEVSTNNTTFTPTVTVGTTGAVTTAPVYVRLSATAQAGTVAGNVVISTTGGATSVNVSATGTVTGGIGASGTLTAFSTVQGTASASQSITVSGSGITNDIVVTPPTGYEVSLVSGSGYGSTLTLTQSGGTVAGTPVFIRLAAANPAGQYSGNVVLSSTGSNSVNVAVTGSVNGSITATGTITAMSTTYGTPSTSRNFNVSDSFLSAGLLVTPPAGFEVSTDNSTFFTSVTLGSTGPLASTTVYVRLASTSLPATYSGNVVLSSTGQTNVTVAIPNSTVSNGATAIEESGNLTQFITNQNTASSIQTFVVSAVNTRTNRNMTVVPPAGFEISLNGTSGWVGSTSSLTVNASSSNNNVAATTIYIRLAANATTGLHAGNVALTVFGLTQVNSPSATGIVVGNITETGTLTAFTSFQGSPSTSKSFTVSDGYLVSPILVTAPANYEVSTDNSTFTPTVTLGSTGALATTTVYVRLAATASLGTSSGNVVLSTSGGPANVNVAVTGTVATSLAVGGNLSEFTTGQGTPSVSQSITVAGSGLTQSIVITPPSGYEVSTDDAIFSGTVSLPQSGGAVPSTPVYIRLIATNVGVFTGNVVVSSTGIANVNVAATGTVYGPIVETGTPTAFNSPANTASPSQSFTVSDTYISGGLLVTAPAGFEVSTDGTTFTNTVSLGSTGALATTPVYVRLAAGALGTYSGNVVLSTTSATSVNVPVTGTVADGISENGALQAFITNQGTASATQNFTISGSNLGTSDITITPPAGYEIGTDNSTYPYTQTSPLVLTQSAGSVPLTTIYVRLAAGTLAGIYSGNITLTTPDPTEIDVAATGTVLAPQTITFAPTNSVVYGTADYSPGATASSNLAVSYSSSNLNVATIVGGNIHVVGVGTTTITATQAGDATYSAATPVLQTLTVTPATLTMPDAAASNKMYDASTSANITGTLTGVFGADVVTFTSAGSGTFDSSGVGTGINVTANIVLTGAQASDYILTQPTGLKADITSKSLNVINVAAVSRPYDGTNIATLTGSPGLSGVVGTEDVSLVTGSVTALFADANIGIGKTVTVNGYSITGTASGNYTLVQPTLLTATITPIALTVTGVIANNKVYDKTTAATLDISSASLTGVLSVDNGNVLLTGAPTASFLDANVANNKPVTITGSFGLSGTPSGNYTVTQPSGLTANITTATLTIPAAVASNKVYDATTVATITGALSGIISGDVVTYTSGGSGTFDSAGVGAGINVTANIILTGAQAGNYALTQPTGLKADITGKSLNVINVTAVSRPYDGTNIATLSGTASLSGVAAGDVSFVTLGGTPIATFADANAGTNKTVTVNGYSITGTASGNYSLVQPTLLTANITKVALTVTGVFAQNKIYDATLVDTLNVASATLSGMIPADALLVTVSGAPTAAFADVNVGTGKSVTITGSFALAGAAAGNYTVTQPGPFTANITAKPLTVTGLSVQNRTYSGTTNGRTSTLTGIAGLSGVVSPDNEQVTGTPVGTFSDQNAGVNKTVTVTGLSLLPANANYTLTPLTLLGTILPKTLTLSNVAVTQKTYDGTTAATITGTLSTLAAGDGGKVTLNGVGTYASANVNTTGILVTPSCTLNLTGSAIGNYVLTQPPTQTGIINAAILTLTATGPTKTYGTALTAGTSTTNFTATGMVNGETVTSVTLTPNAAGLSAATPAGSAYIVVPSAPTGGGATTQFLSSNYDLTNSTIVYNGIVSKAALTVTADDQTMAFGASVPPLTVSYSGFVNSEGPANLTTQPTATSTVTSSTPHGSYPITVAGGVSGNYTFSYVPGTLTVNAAPVTFAAIPSQVYGAPDFDPGATSLAPITYTSSDLTVATIVANQIHIKGVGTTTITATNGDDTQTQSFTVTPAHFTVNVQDVTKSYGDLLTDGSVSSPAFTTNGLVYGETVNSVSIHYGTGSQKSDIPSSTAYLGQVIPSAAVGTFNPVNYDTPTYNAGNIIINPAAITITATGPPKTYGTALSAGTSTTYFSVSATINNETITSVFLTPDDAGTTANTSGGTQYTVMPSGAAGDGFNPANYNITYAPFVGNVAPASQSINFAALTPVTYGDLPFAVTATATSGLPVTFTSSDPAVATVTPDGTVVTILSAGTTNIIAHQAGDNNYSAATDVPQALVVGQKAQSINFAALTPVTYGDLPFAVTATATSGLPVTFTSSDPAVATVTPDGTVVTILSAGTTNIIASQAGDNNYSAATDVPQALVVGQKAQSINFAALAPVTYGDLPFAVTATATSGLPVTFTSSDPAVATVTPDGSVVTILSAGTTNIIASQAGDNNYTPATDVPQALVVGQKAQSINFAALTPVTYGDLPFAVTATATSGLPVTFTSSDPAVATVTPDGSVVTILSAGTTNIIASQAGDNNYTPATDVPQALVVGQKAQSINFAALAPVTYGDLPFAVTATATSGLPVTFTSSDPAVATVTPDGSVVTILSAGTTNIIASQAGDNNYTPATDVPQALVVGQKAQSINFAALAPVTYGDLPFAVTATATSGLPVTFTSSDPAVATVTPDGTVVTILSAGTTNIIASQAGDNNYTPATDVPQALVVGQKAQSINFAALAPVTYGDLPFAVTATATSGLPVTFTSSDPAVATVTPDGSVVTILSAGTTNIIAHQAGDNNYSAATDVPQALVVGQKAQSINFAALTPVTYGDLPFAVTATATSGLPVTFTSSDPAVATVTPDGTVVTILSAGTTNIIASQAGDNNYSAATDVPQALVVGQKAQSINFAALAPVTYGDLPFAVTATATSGLPVTFTSSDPAVATVTPDGSVVTILSAGTTNIIASQAGDNNYTPATDVPQALVVGQKAQSINFAALTPVTYGDLPFAVTATATSGLPVTFTSSDPAVATVTPDGTVVTILSAGTTNIIASQAGDNNYTPATDVPQALVVGQKAQSINFAALAPVTYGDLPFAVTATATSGLPVTFTSSDPAVATVTPDGSVVTILSAGTTNIIAHQAGDNNYSAATDVPQALVVGQKAQSINFAALTPVTYGDLPFAVTATATSGLPVTFTSSDPAVATVTPDGTVVTILSAGTTNIIASQAGDNNYSAATDVPQALVVGQKAQSINFAALAPVTYGDLPFAVTATATSGLPVTFTSSDPAVATVTPDGSVVTILSAGTTNIIASQAGDNNYSAATDVPQALVVGQKAQSINFAALTPVTYGDLPFAVTATATSGLPVTFTSSDPAVATVTPDGTVVTILSAGTTNIIASQAGDNNYTPATDVPQALVVGQKAQSINFAALAPVTYGDLPFAVTATATSGLPVTFTSSDPAVATVTPDGTVVTILSAGTTNIIASQAGDNNYTPATDVIRSLTVNRAPLTITAKNAPKAYGSVLTGGAGSTAFISTGLKNNESIGSVTINYSTVPGNGNLATASVGTYANNVFPSVATDGTFNPANYIITYSPGSIIVGQAVLTVTAVDQNRIYGQPNPSFTVTYDGFQNGETYTNLTTQPTANTTATQSSPVNTYPITASGATSPNYAINYIDGTLNVHPAALTISAADKSKAYGAALPSLTANYSGFVNGDDATKLTTQPILSTTATQSSAVNTYPINVTGATDPNYTITYAPGTLTVTPVELTVTAVDKSKIYGANNPTFTFTYNGFVNGDTQASLTTLATGTSTADANSPVGTYPITPSGVVDPNYTFVYVPGTLTVTPAALTITPVSQSRNYGAANPPLTIGYSGLVAGDTPESLTTQPTATTSATIASPIGTYLITASGASSPNYNISYNTGVLTVTPATLTITADNQVKAYGAALPTLTISYSGFVNGETRAILTTKPKAVTTATATSPAGVYPITVSGAVDPNYTFVYVPGTLTVSPAVLTVTANNQSKTYGSANPALTVSYSGFVNGDTQASLSAQATATTTATLNSAAGTYPITASGAIDPNYTFSYVQGTLTVNPAALTVIVNTLAKTYGAALPTLTVGYSGFVNGDTPASLTTPPIATTVATASSPVGNYPITASGASSLNYTIAYFPGTLIIIPVALFITPDNQTKSVGSVNPPLTVSYSGFVNGDNANSLTTPPNVSTTALTNSPVGTYPISASGAVDANYTIAYSTGTLTVTSAPLAFGPIPAKVYGAGDFDPGASSAFAISYTSSNPAVATMVGNNLHITGVGSSTITATSNGNSLQQILTVTPAALTITANDLSKTYGSANPTLTVSYSGFVNGETKADLTTKPKLTTTATATSPVNTYPISVSSAVDANYTFTYVPGTLTVSPAVLTVTADNQSKNYGSANPALTVSYSGFVNGDSQGSLTSLATASTNATAASLPGNYPITASGAAAANYTFNYVQGTLTVIGTQLTFAAIPVKTYGNTDFDAGASSASPISYSSSNSSVATIVGGFVHIVGVGTSTITATAGSSSLTQLLTVIPTSLTITVNNQSKTYGTANPSLTVNYTGLVNGDTPASLGSQPTVLTTAITSSAVGNYPITASGAIDANYNINYVSGNLAVTPAALTVTAIDNTKSYGTPNPALTVSYSGFVNGDTQGSLSAQATANTAATSASAVGNYPITASGAIDPNYTISYVQGTLTVTSVGLTITANDQTKSYGSANPALTVNYVGFVNGDTQANLTTPPTVITTAVTGSAVGSYPITASGASSSNYTIAYGAPGTLSVTPAALTITADNQTKTVGSENPTLTASYIGFVNGDNSGSLTTLPTITTTATTGSPVGGYPITASGAAGANYTIAYNAGTLTVTAVPLTFAAIPGKVYGAGDFDPGATSAFSISYTSSNSSVAIMVGNNLHIVGVGSSTITATANGSSLQQILTVTPATLTITADNQSKTYGAANPTLTISYSGFVNGETKAALTTKPAISTTATAASAVNTYPISVSGAVDPNYTFTYVAGTLTVNPAVLTATADNQTRAYGAANPALTVSYSGYVNGDSQAAITTPATATTNANAASAPGNYQITPAGAAAANYTFAYVQGTLTVTATPLTFTAIPVKTYGNGDFDAGASSTSPITYTSSNSTVATIVGGLVHIVGVGTSTITATAGSSSLTQLLTVIPTSLTITANNQSKTYGSANPSLTVSYSGFVNGDTQANLSAQPTVLTTAIASSAVGNYPITASGASDANYNITYVLGNLAVTPVSLTITANNNTKTYGAANPLFTVSYSGFVNGDTQASLISAPSVGTTASVSSPVGVYPITASGAAAANYLIAYNTGTLTVTPASLTITANNQTKTYGAANPALTVNYSGFVNGDTQSSLATLPTVTTTADINSTVGTYPITASGAVSANYTIAYGAAGTLTVTPAPMIITANNQTKIQGSVNPPLTVTYSGYVNGESGLATPPTVTTTATTGSPVGGYPITASGAADPDYSISYVAGTLTVTGLPLTFAPISAKTYGTADFDPGASSSNAITYSSSNPAVATIVANKIHITGVGTSTITANDGANSLQQTLSVTQAALTITANNANKTYGATLTGAAGSTAFTSAGLQNGETIGSVTIAYGTGSAAAAAVGTYNGSVTPSAATGGTFVAGNYNITYASGNIIVGQAALTITANNANKTYGAILTGAAGSTAFTTTGLQNGQTIGSVTIAYGTGSAAAAAVGTYNGSVTPSAATGGNFVAGNYNITYASGNIIVGQAALTITANNANKTYGATLTGAAGSTAFTSAGLQNGQTIGSVTIAYGTGSAAAAAVGTYNGSVTPSAATGGTFVAGNYNITYASGNIIIGQAALTITANNANKTYGAILTGAAGSTAFTTTGLQNGQTIGSVTIAYGTGSAAAAAVGTYNGSVTPSAATGGNFVAGNYNITYAAGNIIVGQAPLTVTANNLTKTQGSVNPPLTVTYTGFVNGDTPASLTSTAHVTTTAVTSSPVGTYPITPSGVVGTNYNPSYVAGTLTVTGTTLTFGPIPSKVYGTADFAPGATGSGTITYTSSNTAVATIVAGNIHIVAVGTSTITATSGATNLTQLLTVTAAPLTITATGPSKTYGTALTAGTSATNFTATGAVTGQAVTSVTLTPNAAGLSATTAAGAAYVVSPSAPTGTGGFLASNYSIAFNSFNGTVAKAPLSITANNQSKVVGQANPTLTVTYSGFVNGQTSANLTTQPTVTTTATTGSPAGTYPITVSGAVAANYAISYVPGTLTVSNTTLTFAAIPSKVYGVADFSPGATSNTTINYSSSNASVATIVSGNIHIIGVGTSTITATAGSLVLTQVLTVTKANLTITSYTITKNYGTLLVGGTLSPYFQPTGLQYGETVGSVTQAFGTGAARNAAVGTYAGQVTVSAATGGTFNAANYTITYVTGNIVIGQKPLTITATGPSKVYGTSLTTGTSITNFTHSGEITGEAVTSVTLTPNAAGLSATTAAGVAYTVVPSAPTGTGGFLASNYVITFNSFNGTVAKAPLTVTANNQTKTQGSVNPPLTVTYTGFVNGNTQASLTNTAHLSTTATTTSPVGTYPIAASGVIASNYSPTYVQGTLTVTSLLAGRVIATDIPNATSVNAPANANPLIQLNEPVVRQAVSPNGDGINDVLTIDNIENYPDNKVTLMNRNGVEIFSMSGYDNVNKVFDGHSNINKSMQQPGTYFYLLEYKANGETRRKTGYFIIKY